MSKYFVLAFVGLGLFIMLYQNGGGLPDSSVRVQVPSLSAAALKGQELFNENCSGCHGENGSGSDVGPPLIHDIYKPSHHGDQVFYLAAQIGVRAHHWPYGNMPRQPHIRPEMMTSVIQFVRETQRANGISMQ